MKKWIVQFLFRQKYRFDLGIQLLVFVNFAMMCATMLKVFGIRGYWMLPLIVLAFFTVWGMGWFLDVVVKMQRKTEWQATQRSYTWQRFEENFAKLDEILKRLEEK
jgi:hypothetical protein